MAAAPTYDSQSQAITVSSSPLALHVLDGQPVSPSGQPSPRAPAFRVQDDAKQIGKSCIVAVLTGAISHKQLLPCCARLLLPPFNIALLLLPHCAGQRLALTFLLLCCLVGLRVWRCAALAAEVDRRQLGVA